MTHDTVTWKERHALAWENSKPFPTKASTIATFVGSGLLVGALIVMHKVDSVGMVLIRLAAWAAAAFILTPVVIYLHGLYKAPQAILGGRLAEAGRLQRLAERERDLLIAEKAEVLRPKPDIWFTESAHTIRMNVRNSGAPAVFHANSIVLWANAGRGDVGHAQRLRWTRAVSTESKIVTADKDTCIVAGVKRETQPIMEVQVQAICDSGLGAHQPTQVYWFSNWLPEAVGIEPSRPFALCEITVTAEPEMLGGPIHRRFQLGPGGFHEEGTEGYLFDAEGCLQEDHR